MICLILFNNPFWGNHYISVLSYLKRTHRAWLLFWWQLEKRQRERKLRPCLWDSHKPRQNCSTSRTCPNTARWGAPKGWWHRAMTQDHDRERESRHGSSQTPSHGGAETLSLWVKEYAALLLGGEGNSTHRCSPGVFIRHFEQLCCFNMYGSMMS